MLDHLIDPDIPSSKDILLHNIEEKKKVIGAIQNQLIELNDEFDCAKQELDDLEDELRAITPDPDAERDNDVPDTEYLK